MAAAAVDSIDITDIDTLLAEQADDQLAGVFETVAEATTDAPDEGAPPHMARATGSSAQAAPPDAAPPATAEMAPQDSPHAPGASSEASQGDPADFDGMFQSLDEVMTAPPAGDTPAGAPSTPDAPQLTAHEQAATPPDVAPAPGASIASAAQEQAPAASDTDDEVDGAFETISQVANAAMQDALAGALDEAVKAAHPSAEPADPPPTPDDLADLADPGLTELPEGADPDQPVTPPPTPGRLSRALAGMRTACALVNLPATRLPADARLTVGLVGVATAAPGVLLIIVGLMR